MNFYVPIFSKIVDSSLWDESDLVVKVYLTMLAKKDPDNVVRATSYNVGKWSRKTEAEALQAIRVLESPDTKRMEPQLNEGRRLKKVEGGWLILNAEYYQNLMRKANRNEYQRVKQSEYRSKKKPRRTPTAEEASVIAKKFSEATDANKAAHEATEEWMRSEKLLDGD